MIINNDAEYIQFLFYCPGYAEEFVITITDDD